MSRIATVSRFSELSLNQKEEPVDRPCTRAVRGSKRSSSKSCIITSRMGRTCSAGDMPNNVHWGNLEGKESEEFEEELDS